MNKFSLICGEKRKEKSPIKCRPKQKSPQVGILQCCSFIFVRFLENNYFKDLLLTAADGEGRKFPRNTFFSKSNKE